MARAWFRSRRSLCTILAAAVVLACSLPDAASAQHAPFESPALVNASLVALVSSSQPFGLSAPPRVGTIAPLQAAPSRTRFSASPSGPARPLPVVCGAAGSRRALHTGGRQRWSPRGQPCGQGPRQPTHILRSRQDRGNGWHRVPHRASLEEASNRRRGADGGGQRDVRGHRGAQLPRPSLNTAPALTEACGDSRKWLVSLALRATTHSRPSERVCPLPDLYLLGAPIVLRRTQ